MALWGKLDRANNAPFGQGWVGETNAFCNALFSNTTSSSFVNNQVFGVFGVDQTEAGVKGRGVTPGWNLVRTGTGPVTGVSVTANVGVAFATGETIRVSNGSANGTLTITANGFAGNSTSNVVAGNISSVAVTSGGAGFVTNTGVVVGFNRERHLSTIVYTGTATGYSNTDTIRVANATTNATATVSTNSTGGTLAFTITNLGIFANTIANNQLVVAALAANGANSAGSGATITATVVPSTSGSVTITTLGGRSGRILYENLAVVRTMSNAGADAEDAVFPDV